MEQNFYEPLIQQIESTIVKIQRALYVKIPLNTLHLNGQAQKV